jgi:hypothetical protein
MSFIIYINPRLLHKSLTYLSKIRSERKSLDSSISPLYDLNFPIADCHQPISCLDSEEGSTKTSLQMNRFKLQDMNYNDVFVLPSSLSKQEMAGLVTISNWKMKVIEF